MDAAKAKAMYERLLQVQKYKIAASMNKQKGEKKQIAYLTAMVNMLIEANSDGIEYNHDPRELTTVTKDGMPLRTLSRRVDGAFPTAVNPVAVWEIKEYYHTTTFGSRVADGVYETLLDGNPLPCEDRCGELFFFGFAVLFRFGGCRAWRGSQHGIQCIRHRSRLFHVGHVARRWIVTGIEINQAKQQENSQEQESRAANDGIDWLVIDQVHEDQ